MSGTSLELNYTDRTAPIVTALQRLQTAGKRPRPLLLQIGEYLIDSTSKRFDAQESPEGTRWTSVDPVTWALKKIKKMLTESSGLRDSINYSSGLIVSDGSIVWGSNVIYSRIHQLGGRTKAHDIRAKKGGGLMFPGLSHPIKVVHHPGSIIPARPYLGISTSDVGEILGRIHDYLGEAVKP